MTAVPTASKISNAKEAADFLSTLDPGACSFDFRVFDDGEQKRPELTRTFSCPVAEAHDSLASLSAKGAGIFVTVNETDGGGLTAAHVTRVRALFVDLDSAPLANLTCLKLQPSIIVSTSPGRYHAYYLASDVLLDEFEGLQRRLSALFGSDPKIKDLPRVMRLPGFPHQKGEQFMVAARYASTRLVRTRDEIVRKLEDAERHFGIVPPRREPWPEYEPPLSPPPATQRDRKYAQAALDAECAEVAGATPGSRNDRLNKAAASLGGLVASELLSRSECEGRLLDAAKASGLGFDESRKTISSGLNHGAQRPRGRPSSGDWQAPSKPNGDAFHDAPAGQSNGSAEDSGALGCDSGTDSVLDAEIKRLASLSMANYERERKAAAERLGFRASVLDRLVAAERPHDEAASGQGKVLVFDEPEPWPKPVDGAALLDELETLVRRFIVCSGHAAAAMTLWIALTWFEEGAQIAPILSFRSPVMRCGKSTCLAVIGRLVKRRLLTSNTTTAALFRAIEKFQPTLIVDEADTFFAQNEELRGIINSGHTRETAHILRTVGEDLEPRTFSTWSFKAVAGIGNLASTIVDRSITIDLQRKTKDEKVSRLRHGSGLEFETLSRKLARFSLDNMTRFAQARPELPDTLNDRQQDNWDHLLALAGLASGTWPRKAREAALKLCGETEDADTQKESLLADIFEVLNDSNYLDDQGNVKDISERSSHAAAGRPKEVVGIASELLVDKLAAMADRPWRTCTRGKELTQHGLARKLKPFHIRPKTIGSGKGSMKGYDVAKLVAEYRRYCTQSCANTCFSANSGIQSVATSENNNFNDLAKIKSSQITPEIVNPSQIIYEQYQRDNLICDGATVQNPESSAHEESDAFSGPGECEF